MHQNFHTLPYVELISLLNETNRPPGGKGTVRYWIQNAFITSSTRVLEIGCNTGFTSLELARCTSCHVVGIDVSASAIECAQENLRHDVGSIQNRVHFQVGDAHSLDFPADSFDAIVCGGALSFVRDRPQAIQEIRRVSKPWGFVCVSPLCYHSPPPSRLLADLETVLGFPLHPYRADDWRTMMTGAGFEEYHTSEVKLQAKSEARIDEYVTMLAAGYPAFSELDEDLRATLHQRLLQIFSIFNENHRYLQFLAGIFRKRHLEEQEELFVLPSSNS